ncbi:MAG TPA: amino acid permease [Methanoregulaceae archaeon]|nr:amino acid permease [Methanoregulaceae archaeon]
MADKVRLKREIGLFGASALGIGAIVGSGIFIVTGIVAGLAGPAMILSILIAGAIAVFSAMSVAELSAYLPEEGGTYSFARKLISPFTGYIAGWIWVFSNIFVGAAVSLGFAQYFVTIFPAIPVKVIAVIVCFSFLLINYFGVRESTLINNVLVIFKVLILLFFIAFALGYFKISNFTPFAPAGPTGILMGAALIFFAYTGFARVTIMAEEVKDPENTIPRSIYVALGVSTLLYIFVGLMATGLVGTAVLSHSTSPLAKAISITGSPLATLIISIGAMIATASVLLTTIMGVSRIVFAMGRSDDLPAFAGRLHPRFSTPHYAICMTGACMIAAILLADLTLVVGVSTFAMLVYYLIANIAAMKIPSGIRRYPAIIPFIGGDNLHQPYDLPWADRLVCRGDRSRNGNRIVCTHKL